MHSFIKRRKQLGLGINKNNSLVINKSQMLQNKLALKPIYLLLLLNGFEEYLEKLKILLNCRSIHLTF